ncbi:DUF4190 domain-containing protein [Mycolicibacterium fortuitum]|nr:DUF4190 domain-containing protein [Mycolicibacterium fortuitum]
MTNADGNAGETRPPGSGSQPSEPSSGGYEAPPIEHSQDRPDTGAAQPSYGFAPPDSGAAAPYPRRSTTPPTFRTTTRRLPGCRRRCPEPPAIPADARISPTTTRIRRPGGYPVGASGYPGYPGGYGMPPANPTNSMAIGSLAASVLGLFLLFACGIGLLAALVGIGLGIVALNQIKQSAPAGYGPQAEQPGRGLAVAGIALGAFGTLLNGGWLLFFIASVLST